MITRHFHKGNKNQLIDCSLFLCGISPNPECGNCADIWPFEDIYFLVCMCVCVFVCWCVGLCVRTHWVCFFGEYCVCNLCGCVCVCLKCMFMCSLMTSPLPGNLQRRNSSLGLSESHSIARMKTKKLKNQQGKNKQTEHKVLTCKSLPAWRSRTLSSRNYSRDLEEDHKGGGEWVGVGGVEAEEGGAFSQPNTTLLPSRSLGRNQHTLHTARTPTLPVPQLWVTENQSIIW